MIFDKVETMSEKGTLGRGVDGVAARVLGYVVAPVSTGREARLGRFLGTLDCGAGGVAEVGVAADLGPGPGLSARVAAPGQGVPACGRGFHQADAPGIIRKEVDEQEIIQGKVNDWKAMLTAGSPADMTQAMRGLMPFFELPLETWTRTVSGFSVLPGDFLQALKPEGLRQATDEVHDQIGRFLSVPSVGYTREWQDQNQRGARLVLDYQRASQEYLNAHARLGVDTIERFSKRVMERAETGQEITSLREVYDLWVDAGEAAYSEFVLTEEYAAIYGRLVNALMALKTPQPESC